ncbi:MAG: aldehyde dehydrogenase family protein [Clostridiales bacterium]|nr:aldehyde dehydrogenase family protein [Clostridiales bacterium]
MLVTPEGNFIHGWFFLYIFWKYYAGIKEYQVIQEKLDKIVIKIVPEDNFDEKYIAVVEPYGGRESIQALLQEKFDYIFFTGSVLVGKLVMAQASKHLTPVTLELGGKSPCIVDQTADIEIAAKRIAWGKLLNSGQTCVAPDYILVHKDVKKRLLTELGKSIEQLYGKEPHKNPDFPKIINQKHFERLLGLMDSGKIVVGGQSNTATNQISPTVLDNVSWESMIMQEEIFGPILPVIEFDNLEEVVKMVNARPKPLALYYFTNSKSNEQYIMKHISFGGGCVNDTIVHLASSHLAFGGVGESGMGSYHGEESYRAFSHRKGVLKKSNLVDVPLRYHPFGNKLKLLKKILK